MANNTLRMSGMNSGLDTESIINALTANSKLKITKQNRQLLKYKATQEAYRDVISKLTNLQDKYFDILNKKSNLKGSTMWSQYTGKTTVNGEEKKIPGFSITSSINSVPGDYKVKVNKTATQATVTGASLSSGAKLDLASISAGENYGLTITVGDVTKNISFTGGATESETLDNVNKALSDAFGESNSSAGVTGNKGLVYVEAGTGQIVSRSGKGVTLSGAGALSGSTALDFSDIKSGNNTISVRIGGELKIISFQTLANDYFDGITFNDDGSYEPVTEENALKAELYKQIKDDYIESKKYEAYLDWKNTLTDDDREVFKKAQFDKAEAKQRENHLNKYLAGKFDEYRAEAGDSAGSFDDWKAANFNDNDDTNELYNGFVDYYYDKTELSDEQIALRDEKVQNFWNDEYQKYTDGGGTDDLDTWKAAQLADTEGDIYKAYEEVYNSVQPEKGYQLDYDLWGSVSYNEYAAYKEDVCTVTEESLNITNQNIVDHYNKTSIENSLGALETESGVKLKIGFNDTDGTGSVIDNISITAEDADGNSIDFSISIGKGSVNNFGLSEVKTSVSQISNSTLLSDLGIEPNADGNYTFKINGKDFSFSGETTVKEMMRAVNGSDANVKMTYSSLDNAFKITASDYGVNSKIDIEDGAEGFLSAIGLGAGSTFEAGTNLEVEINGRVLESDSNALEVDGTTFTFSGVAAGTEFDVTVEKDNSAIADVIKGFVEDYNKIIEEVYDYLDEKPDKDYYFLADADKEELDLSEKQEEKWEEKAKQGILYHDSTISSVMTKLRTALMGSITAADGSSLSLSKMGITTESDYKEHGKLILDEDALNAAINEYGDDIAKLFGDSENGIMVKFDAALESAIGTTGNKGTLINKAGLEKGTTATDNKIYNQMKRITEKIKTLEKRYETEQNRLWKKYSAMEKMLGNLNSQQSSFSSYFGTGM